MEVVHPRLSSEMGRVRFLDMQPHARTARRGRQGRELRDDRLLRLVRRWLSAHEAIGGLLPGMPEPEHVRQVQAILRGTDRFGE